jgi:putative transposase
MDLWVLDEHNRPARPWLTIVLEDYSRAVAGYALSLHAPSSIQTAAGAPAARAQMTHQSMSELVVGLEAAGFVQRVPDPADGRAKLICLTPLGRRVVRKAVEEIANIEAAWFQQNAPRRWI